MSRTMAFAALALLMAAGVACSSVEKGSSSPDALTQHKRLGGDPSMLNALEAELADLESDVQQLAVHQAILDNELQYTRGLDRHDEALIDSAFWPDASISYGKLIGADEVAVWANESHAAYAAHQHHVTGVSLDIEGDTAHEEGYVLFSSDLQRDISFDTEGVRTPGRVVAGSFAGLGTGRYVNRYERRNGEWRMIVHEYVHDISMRLEAVDLCATSCLGTWDATDISYLRPLESLSVEERRQRAERGTTPRASVSPASQDGTRDAQ